MWLRMVKPTVISTFAGGGGSSLGYKWAGYRELLAIDFDKNAIETLKANYQFPVWEKDIRKITGQEIMNFCKLQKGQLDILDGSPPCQGFSTAGKRNVSDRRNDLFREYVRLLKELQPKVFVMENVSGLIKGSMKSIFNRILKDLQSANYVVKVKLMNAMWYDVPQSRERVIFIGVRKDINVSPSFPTPQAKITTASSALKTIKPLTLGSHSKSAQSIFEKIMPGKAGFLRNGKQTHFNYVKVHPNKPAPTMLKSVCYCGAGYYHWKENRSMSMEEMKILCSFPLNYKLIGKFEEQWARLGNAVMPKMMYHIALHVRKTILEKI